jgi:hypothetical protein
MSAAAAPLQAQIAQDSQQANQRQSALDTQRSQSAAAQDATLAPMEAAASTQIGDLSAMQPPKKADLPAYQPKPLVDPQEYQKVSWGLIGMALIGGIASKGNWMGVSASLNGALKGFLDGNHERAAQEYQDYKTQFERAKAKSEAEQKEFADILQNRRLTINNMLTQIKITAAKYGRDDVRMEAEQKSIDGIWRRVEAMDDSIRKSAEQNIRLQEQITARMQLAQQKAATSGGAEQSDRAQALQAEMAVRGVTLPQGMRSAKQANSILNNIAAHYPDKDTSELVDMIKNNQIDMKIMLGEAGVMAKREASTAAAIQTLNQPGGLYDQLRDAAKKVNFGNDKVANDWRLAAQGHVVANPDIQRLRNLISDTQAEVVSVLSRTGQPTESVRKQAGEMFPLDGSIPELETAIDASKKVAEAIQAGNENVIQVLKAKGMKAAAQVVGDESAHNKYTHSSGATVEILSN